MNQFIHRVAIFLAFTMLSGGWSPQYVKAQGDPTGPEAPDLATPTPLPESASDGALSASDELSAQVEALLARMTVADRVGQLFLITFEGRDASFDSDIAELIHGYRIGGVVLSPENGNFTNEKGVDTPRQVATLTNQLQALAYGLLLSNEQALQAVPYAGLPPLGSVALEEITDVPPGNIPLLIAVAQHGDNIPGTALRRGFTPLPSQMALGATWNPDLARQVGQIVGREVNAVGVNLLLGPSLDVVELPRTDHVGSLGIRSFGGDPYWVAQMGRAYIAGVHTGSTGRVATVAGHFPGAGDIDRLPDQEIATVQRSLAELQRVTLAPFLAVARQPSSLLMPEGDPSATDAMISSHTRYSGIQGNSLGRNTPISLAPELSTLLAQEGFSAWREGGGILVSNRLGVPAIRRYYSPALEDFPYRRVALDAFTAGHDLLYLDRFGLDDQWETEKRNIKETVGFFQERYVEDAGFAAQVDAAVRRILRLKLQLYVEDSTGTVDQNTLADARFRLVPTVQTGEIPLEAVLVEETDLTVLGEDRRTEALMTVSQVARESITILYPDPASSTEIMSIMPQAGDNLLIFTESRLQRECETCIAEAAVGPDELADIIVRLYGPEATDQIAAEQISSLTFADLVQLLSIKTEETPNAVASGTPGPAATPEASTTPEADSTVGNGVAEAAPEEEELDKNEKIERAIQQADWLIFAMLDVDPERHPGSGVLKQFLRQHGDQLSGKHIVVLALHAPYFLDATEISKVSSYYGVYSKAQPFVEGAVRALFRAYSPSGAPPVSVPGTRFGSLAERLQPDPNRQIDLAIQSATGEVLSEDGQAQAVPIPAVDAGTLVRLHAGPVFDLNGKPVRDGTVVDFRLVYDGEEAPVRTETAQTRNGVATRDVVLEQGGIVRITAQTAGVTTGEPVALSVVGAPQAQSTAETTTSTFVLTTATPAPEPLAMSVPAPEPVRSSGQAATPDLVEGERVSLVSLLIAMLTMMAAISVLVLVQVHMLPRKTLVHSLLWAVNFGLAAYVLYGLGLVPGTNWLQNSLRSGAVALVVLIAMLPPLLWLQLRTE